MRLKENMLNVKLIEKFMDESRLSRAEFARMCKVNKSVIDRILSGSLREKFVHYIKVSGAMGIYLDELLDIGEID
ncbi:MAG: hypothetical protein FWE01_01895 [Firmicutes bacterium]|nr:hypothetical protein [Bacillota bacterium]